MATKKLRCPVCRIDLPEDGTHCQRCGLRVAALPRRPRPEGATPRRRRLAEAPRAAALQGGAVAVAGVAAVALLGVVIRAAGGPGKAFAGDVLLAAAGLLVLVAALMPGLHMARWAEREVMAERAEAAHRIDPRRAFVLGAAAVCAAGLLAVAALPS
jgi:hypothetical protein